MCQNGPTCSIMKKFVLKLKEGEEGNICVWCLQFMSNAMPGTSYRVSHLILVRTLRQILLLSSFYMTGKRLREGKEFVPGHTTSKKQDWD